MDAPIEQPRPMTRLLTDRRARRRGLAALIAAAVVAAAVVLMAGGGTAPSTGAAGQSAPAAAGTGQGAPAGGTPTAPAATPTPSPPARRKPNIVFVLTDDLSMDLLRYMPAVQALEARGMTFNDYFVSDSLCCPSRASIFTGNFPHDTHVFTNSGSHGGMGAWVGHQNELHTFNVALQNAGYRTAMMGKYINGYLSGRSPVPNRYIPRGWNQWDVAGWGYPEFDYPMNVNGTVRYFGHRPADYLTSVLTRRGESFIDRSAAAGRPFFLELATFSPHYPYTPAPRDAHAFPGLQAPRPPSFDALPTDPPAWLANHPPLSAGQVDRINRAFRRRVESVQSVDRMLMRIEEVLRARHLMGNTYIVFSSDNGLHTGEYRMMPGKLTAFDTDIHVPLVIAGPRVVPGSATAALTENVDLADTFTAMGGTAMRSSDGHSLMPLLHGQPPLDWRTAVLVEHHHPMPSWTDPDAQSGVSGNPPSYEAMRTRRFLYVEYIDGEREFYDLRRDPYELHNLAAGLSPAQLTALHAQLARLEDCHGAAACWAAGHVGAALNATQIRH
jgi:arylsulfatase A-like enzyme